MGPHARKLGSRVIASSLAGSCPDLALRTETWRYYSCWNDDNVHIDISHLIRGTAKSEWHKAYFLIVY